MNDSGRSRSRVIGEEYRKGFRDGAVFALNDEAKALREAIRDFPSLTPQLLAIATALEKRAKHLARSESTTETCSED